MDKYINVDELKRKRYIIEEAINPFTGKKCENVIGERRYVTYAEIDEMPGADVVEVKHGEWINPEMGYEDCSVCGYCFAVYDEHDHYIERNFCPNCGADMRKWRKTE